MVAPVPKVIQPRAFAAGSSSGGSSRGANVERTGLSTANSADCSATIPYSSSTERTSRTACATRTSDSRASPALVHIARRRRSKVSASAPPNRPRPMSGTSAARPTRPTAAELSVRSKTWMPTATAVSCVPRKETPCAIQIRRYSGETRSGVRSTARRRSQPRDAGSTPGPAASIGPVTATAARRPRPRRPGGTAAGRAAGSAGPARTRRRAARRAGRPRTAARGTSPPAKRSSSSACRCSSTSRDAMHLGLPRHPGADLRAARARRKYASTSSRSTTSTVPSTTTCRSSGTQDSSSDACGLACASVPLRERRFV